MGCALSSDSFFGKFVHRRRSSIGTGGISLKNQYARAATRPMIIPQFFIVLICVISLQLILTVQIIDFYLNK
jgi:hypothetical protein